ncbi:SecY subunit of pre protein translocase [Gilbertella persicaria]|uniref:SecY subunit of pre protein translocase n=1 Tax=Gilbertella persicaria TaxID=101096 RepID=UPI00221F9F6F|nr:SecY subunit of pre protein translocase [Gilbertella persicaria]KAI8092152.1 SecY subunit of pre protein translocase [Gilbertella persicaria]
MGIRVLRFFKPFMAALPEIESPDRKVPFNFKLLYTVITLFAYLVMSQLPLYGVVSSDSSDPLYWFRTVLASSRGTLMELGVLPILTSGMVLQLLAASNVIHVDYSLKEDRSLFCGAQKLFAVLIAITQATLLVFTGLYGNPIEIGTIRCGLLILQLVFSSYVTILLDELLQKGYGMGSGINIFVAANVCQTIFWKALSFSTIATIRGNEYEGALISLFHLISSRKDKARALKDAFYRSDLTNVMSVMATLATFAFVIYIQGFRIELPVKSNRLRGQRANYPIKFFYTSSMPIMLQTALFANVFLFSQTVYTYFGSNLLIRVLGVWEPVNTESNQLIPTGGLVYYISTPRSLTEAIFAPVHTAVYVSITLIICAYFSKVWVDISGSSSRDVAKTLKDQQLTIAGFRDVSMYKELQRVIPVAASFGGAALAIIAVIADIFGVIGSGAGILMCVMIIFQYFEMFVREQMEGNMTMEAMMAGQ